ncbi:hypothetical protein B0T17DRAFT_534776 [Bombardia bombarda]|uniref:Uncharacterized protein n=1 Tax=Bombardia bombarda TaxID=252184 RepID=A0AA39WUH3_9PEZI|nr:hypothetical protein B0T17DRAFT_534776 [Bombardia bombarda]
MLNTTACCGLPIVGGWLVTTTCSVHIKGRHANAMGSTESNSRQRWMASAIYNHSQYVCLSADRCGHRNVELSAPLGQKNNRINFFR